MGALLPQLEGQVSKPDTSWSNLDITRALRQKDEMGVRWVVRVATWVHNESIVW